MPCRLWELCIAAGYTEARLLAMMEEGRRMAALGEEKARASLSFSVRERPCACALCRAGYGRLAQPLRGKVRGRLGTREHQVLTWGALLAYVALRSNPSRTGGASQPGVKPRLPSPAAEVL